MNWDIFFKCLAAFFGLVTVCTGVINLVTAHRRSKQLQHEQRQAQQLQENILLATRTEQRVTSLESRVGNFENRMEHNIEGIRADISKVKDYITDYLLKH